MDDMGVTVTSGDGAKIPLLWERHGNVVSYVFAPAVGGPITVDEFNDLASVLHDYIGGYEAE